MVRLRNLFFAGIIHSFSRNHGRNNHFYDCPIKATSINLIIITAEVAYKIIPKLEINHLIFRRNTCVVNSNAILYYKLPIRELFESNNFWENFALITPKMTLRIESWPQEIMWVSLKVFEIWIRYAKYTKFWLLLVMCHCGQNIF